MAESLFDIFGDHITRQAVKNVARQPLSNIENMGKTISSGPIKPNEPKKPGDVKKSFLSNTGKALQGTPRQVFTPRPVNMSSLIYNDEATDDAKYQFDELKFTQPKYNYDNYHSDLLDRLPLPDYPTILEASPPNTPPPAFQRQSLEFDCSYQDEFFTDDFSNGSLADEDLNLPDLY